VEEKRDRFITKRGLMENKASSEGGGLNDKFRDCLEKID